MPYIPPEVITEAKKIDLLTYLQHYEPHELVRFSADTYTTRSHDSLKISNGKWMWWSQGIGGKNALDYLTKVKGFSFLEAVKTLMGNAEIHPTLCCTEERKEEPKKLLLPPKSDSNDKVIAYLFGRGIDIEIIQSCIKEGLIFESLPHHNVIFVGKDEKGEARYAAYRATGNARIMGDATGSDKHYSFRLEGTDQEEVHLFECAIDALSFASLTKLNGAKWRAQNLVSLAGVYAPKKQLAESKIPAAVEGFLKTHSQIKRIVIHFDNDIAGRKATEALRIQLSEQYEVVDNPPAKGKDFNDFLCFRLGIFNKPKERSFKR